MLDPGRSEFGATSTEPGQWGPQHVGVSSRSGNCITRRSSGQAFRGPRARAAFVLSSERSRRYGRLAVCISDRAVRVPGVPPRRCASSRRCSGAAHRTGGGVTDDQDTSKTLACACNEAGRDGRVRSSAPCHQNWGSSTIRFGEAKAAKLRGCGGFVQVGSALHLEAVTPPLPTAGGQLVSRLLEKGLLTVRPVRPR